MEMKWHPIVNGDLSGIQQQETLFVGNYSRLRNKLLKTIDVLSQGKSMN